MLQPLGTAIVYVFDNAGKLLISDTYITSKCTAHLGLFWAKCIIQELWMQKLDWDVTPPPLLVDKWSRFTNEFPSLSDLCIPRFIGLRHEKYALLLGISMHP